MKQRSFLLILTLVLVNSLAGATEFSNRHIDKLIKQMTLDEKVHLLVGTTTELGEGNHKVEGAAGFTYAIDRLHIPSLNLADGPVGVRIHPCPEAKEYTSYCTAFPSSSALAATWDKDLVYQEGVAIGAEAYAYGVDVVLTPGINIMRNPLCGRNFEYLSEDPVLGGLIAANMINGIQSNGVGTSLKHFIANNQQINKLNNDSRIPVRALREIYLKGFEVCLQNSNPWTIMASYNKIGGTLTQTNKELLITLLRDEWQYDGIVMSDWYKTRHTVEQINAGLALLMPGEQQQIDEITTAVKEGKISMNVIDSAVKSMLQLVGKSLSAKGWKYTQAPDLEAHRQLSRQIATESMVLLKNDKSILPIKGGQNIALFGASAYHSLAGGGGSSNVNKARIVDIADGLETEGFILNQQLKNVYNNYVASQVELLQKNDKATDWEKISYNRVIVPEMNLAKADKFIARQAEVSDLAVVVVGRSSTEEADRRLENDFYLSKEEKTMVENVSKTFHEAGKKVIVVLNVCGVIEMNSWNQLPDAILLAWLPGEECGNAIADVIMGKANPSGKLPMTFPIDYWDMPSSNNYPLLGKEKSGKNWDYTNYEENIWVGYRYFTSVNKPVAYPFGFGLSYTNFKYSAPKITKNKDKWEVRVTVTNEGKIAGKEAVQLYVSAPQNDIVKPSRELKAFAKTKMLQPGESEELLMTISHYDLASFDAVASQWITVNGNYNVIIASNSEKAEFTLPLNVKKTSTWKVNNILNPVEEVKEMVIDVK